MGIIFAAMLLPGISQLVNERYEYIMMSIFTLPGLSDKGAVLAANVPLLGISLYAVLFWFMTLTICILTQLPANILINEITKMLTTDELFYFFKDCIFEDRLKKANKLQAE